MGIMTQRRSGAGYGLRHGLKAAVAAAFVLAGIESAMAGPDACTLDDPVAVCQGN
jgi:hypothetical protein